MVFYWFYEFVMNKLVGWLDWIFICMYDTHNTCFKYINLFIKAVPSIGWISMLDIVGGKPISSYNKYSFYEYKIVREKDLSSLSGRIVHVTTSLKPSIICVWPAAVHHRTQDTASMIVCYYLGNPYDFIILLI